MQQALTFLHHTAKASGAVLGVLTALSAQTWLPEPYNTWVALGAAVLTWVVTYFLPYATTVVEHWDDPEPPALPAAPVEGLLIGRVATDTNQIPAQVPGPPTAPIETIDHVPGFSVDEFFARLERDGDPLAIYKP